MSGIRFLLDTNIVIGLTNGDKPALKLLQSYNATPQASGYSFITRIELLTFPALTDSEAQNITAVLEKMQYLSMTPDIEKITIQIRRQYGLKIPDAIIAATARLHNLTLVTLDQRLANRMAEISEQV